MQRPFLLFVTGKLAEPALRRVVADLSESLGFDYAVVVLPITVAALATTSWIAQHLSVPAGVQRILIPGRCLGELRPIEQAHPNVAVERGPDDLRDLPEYFAAAKSAPGTYTAFDITILAEINHAPRWRLADLLRTAHALIADGADVIDVGCDPGGPWPEVGQVVRALRAEGMRVSIDSFDPHDIEASVEAGAELVLSVNSANVGAARSWGCEVVAMPDTPAALEGLDTTIERLTAWGVPFRIDPILEPIGLGFAAALGRYAEVRRRYPDAEMLMGVGNVTELTDVDSAGINVMLAGFCQELGVRSVLTTQVINWCRSCVRELDLARRLVHQSCAQRVLPKHLQPDLVMLRDPKLRTEDPQMLADLARRITDRNFRLFADGGLLHVINKDMHLQGLDPFELFEKMQELGSVEAAHAFYLGFELAKALTALTLGKNYVQDQPLRWGLLPALERSHHDPGSPTAEDPAGSSGPRS